MEQQQRVKVAVQKSGRLTENSLDLLSRCGLRYSRSRERLFCFGENMPVDVMLVRDDDIPHLVRDGVCDLGIVGLNVLEEKCNGAEQNLRRISALDFGHCRLSLAVPEDFDYQGVSALSGKRIATSYPKVLGDYLSANNVQAGIVEFSGAVEIAPRLGQADLICDLVSSGGTLLANHLREVEVLLESESWLVAAPQDKIEPARGEWVDRLIQRVEGVQQVNGSKYIMLHAPRSELKRITSMLPGSETPTVMPLDGSDDRVAVHAVCRETVFWETLERLKSAGASSMLVLPVEKMLS
ncbi:MAG: ATP phosphoribosyltransferase [Gammaproteobacteria bacterium]|nr:ATP phosphoribosyltransferase [Gammaproteobacteria bacterium]